MHKISLFTLFILLAGISLAGCKPKTTPSPSLNMANPASVNCEQKGGKVQIETGPDGGQFGVCIFPENKQCEEWAMQRGECPVGGVEVSSYKTDSGRFCAISGGVYTATEKQGTSDEKGTCTFKSGKTCDATEYFNGKCAKE